MVQLIFTLSLYSYSFIIRGKRHEAEDFSSCSFSLYSVINTQLLQSILQVDHMDLVLLMVACTFLFEKAYAYHSVMVLISILGQYAYDGKLL